MRRLLFLLLFFCATAYLYEDIIGLLMKAGVRLFAKSRLAYRDLRIQQGKLLLEDAILFDVSGGKSVYLLRSEAIWLDWTELFSVSIRLINPRLTLSSDVFKNPLLRKADRAIAFDIQIEEGFLDWSDGALPPAKFSYLPEGLSVRWERGSLTAFKHAAGWQIVGTEIPAEFGSCYLPISDPSGSLSAAMHIRMDGACFSEMSLQAKGSDLSFGYGNLRFGGSFTLDWEAAQFDPFQMKSLLTGTQRLRLLIERGFATSDASSLQEAELLGTYHAGLGAQWEVKGSLCSLQSVEPCALSIALEAQAFMPSRDPVWAGGTCHLGNAESQFAWGGEAWQVAWTKLGPAEGAVLQGFAVALDPRASGWQWDEGVIQGALEVRERDVHVERLEGEGVALRAGAFDARCAHVTLQEGKWSVRDARIQSQLPVQWRGDVRFDSVHRTATLEGVLGEDPAGAHLLFDGPFSQAVFSGAVGELRFEGTASRISDAEIACSIPQFKGALPGWIRAASALPIQSGWVSSIGSGLEARWKWEDAWQLTGWTLDCHTKDIAIAIPQWNVTGLQGVVHANAESCDWMGVHGALAIAVGGQTLHVTVASPRMHWTPEGNASFDIRLQEQQWDVLRIVGTKEGEMIHIDPLRSSLFDAPLVFEECFWGQDAHLRACLNVSVAWERLETFLKAKQIDALFAREFEGDLQLCIAFEQTRDEWTASFDSLGASLQWRGMPMPLHCKLRRSTNTWRLSSLQVGPLSASCLVSKERGAWRVEQGRAALYLNNLKNWEFGKEAAQIFASGANGIALEQDVSEDQKVAANLPQPKTNFSSCLGINRMGVSFDFHGKLSEALHLSLENVQADLSQFALFLGDSPAPVQGTLEGQGCMILTLQTIESDLDLIAKNLAWDDIRIEQEDHPLHLYLSSEKKAYVTGISARMVAGDLEAHASADLVELDWKEQRIGVQKARVHIPSSFAQLVPSFFDADSIIDAYGNGEYCFQERRWNCSLREAFLPLFGALRHVKDTGLSMDSHQCSGSALYLHQGQWAKVAAHAIRGEHLQGSLRIEELNSSTQTPLSIDWSYHGEEGLTVHSIQGTFAGLDASFHAVNLSDICELVGSVEIDFQQLSTWIPADVAEVFHELEMGKGYALKGKLFIPQSDPSQLFFQGLFCGKEIDLIGYQFKTLMAEAVLKPTEVLLSELRISDSAGLLAIHEILLRGDAEHPWTIAIPELTIQELRPSLLRNPDTPLGPLTPLVVRNLTITDFKGLLDDGKTYTALGRLSFVNSFKREATVFDLPSHLFGRIIGLDLELLIPVAGDLSFELKEGFFQLTALQNAFSEGDRSEFFLVHSDASPRMDLKGNLEILVTMKQFVLFALTEAFMISIDGKLSDPQFSLQKKRRFL